MRSIIRMVDRNEYKRKQAAPGLKTTPLAFGVGRRMPIVQKVLKLIASPALILTAYHSPTTNASFYKSFSTGPKTHAGWRQFARACLSIRGGTPFFTQRADGAHLYTTDDRRLIDFVCTWGPAIHGHNDPEIKDAIAQALQKGTSFGTQIHTRSAWRNTLFNWYHRWKRSVCVIVVQRPP